jgi:hypothetical protein
LVTTFTRYSGNDPGKILKAIAETFDTDIVADEPQFFGYETWDEMHAAIHKSNDEFYTELWRYLRGEPHEITPGTVGMTWAVIGKRLVETDSSLLLPENRDKLLKEISSIYDRIHTVMDILTPEDVVLANMIVTQRG